MFAVARLSLSTLPPFPFIVEYEPAASTGRWEEIMRNFWHDIIGPLYISFGFVGGLTIRAQDTCSMNDVRSAPYIQVHTFTG